MVQANNKQSDCFSPNSNQARSELFMSLVYRIVSTSVLALHENSERRVIQRNEENDVL